MFGKKKTIEKSLIKVLREQQELNKRQANKINLYFNIFEKNKVKKYKENTRLIPFKFFLERYENILLNNKTKPWFNIKKGLAMLDDGSYPIYKKISTLDNLEQIEYILNNEDYTKYSIIFNEKNISKQIVILRYVKELYKTNQAYKSITTWPIWGFVWNVLFWVWLVVFSTIAVYWGLLDWGMVSYEIFSKYTSFFEQLTVNIFYWANYIDNSFITVLSYLKATYFFLFLTLVMTYSLLSFFTFLNVFRIREVDKIINELNFLTLLKIKIKKLELEDTIGSDSNGEKIYLHKNFLDLIRETILYCLKKNYTNQDFTNDILQILNLYLATKKFPKETKLTEGFQNLVKMILDWYYSMLNWTNQNFNLWAVEKWITEYKEEIEKIQWEKYLLKEKTMMATISNMITTSTIVITLLMSFSQWKTLEKVIKLSM